MQNMSIDIAFSVDHSSGIAKPWHTQARARANYACAIAFGCHSFKLAPHMEESTRNRKKEEADQQQEHFLRCALFLLHLLGLKTQQMRSWRS